MYYMLLNFKPNKQKMDEMILTFSDYLIIVGFIGIVTGCYSICFFHYERKNLQNFIKDTIDKKLV